MFHASDHYGRAGVALHAISAIDIALWDIAGKGCRGVPSATCSEGRRIADVPVYASEVMPESVDEVRGIAERAASAGYPALKLGLGPVGPGTPSTTSRSSPAAREALGPERTLMLDGGRAYSVKSALQLLQPRRGARSVLVRGGARARRSRRVSASLGCDDRCASQRRARPMPPCVRSAPSSSRATSTCCSPTSHAAVASPSSRESRCSSAASAVQIVPHCFSTAILVAASLHFVATLDRPTWSEFSVADSTLVNGILREPFPLRGGAARRPNRARPGDRDRRRADRPASGRLEHGDRMTLSLPRPPHRAPAALRAGCPNPSLYRPQGKAVENLGTVVGEQHHPLGPRAVGGLAAGVHTRARSRAPSRLAGRSRRRARGVVGRSGRRRSGARCSARPGTRGAPASRRRQRGCRSSAGRVAAPSTAESNAAFAAST